MMAPNVPMQKEVVIVLKRFLTFLSQQIEKNKYKMAHPTVRQMGPSDAS
jgi:hypothetical protein